MSFQSEKSTILTHYEALDQAGSGQTGAALGQHVAQTCVWRGYHPFHILTGPDQIAATFWDPLKTSLTSLQRRQDIFMAGRNEMDGFGSTWVVSMGQLMGLFDQPWLGIPPTGKMAFLRYCEFNKVEGGQITETAMYFDIPHLMMQAGLAPFGPQTAAHFVQPGPMTHDGLMFDAQPEAEGQATLAAINKMCADLGTWQLGLPLEEELARTWHDDMIWWGPAGIGSTYTIERYAKQHSGPFRAAFSDRAPTNHLCRLAEGQFGGFFGWPNFTARQTGPFMGRPATNKVGEMRVIDIYRRSGDKLAENWVFIDLLHFWNGLGWDVLGEIGAS